MVFRLPMFKSPLVFSYAEVWAYCRTWAVQTTFLGITPPQVHSNVQKPLVIKVFLESNSYLKFQTFEILEVPETGQLSQNSVNSLSPLAVNHTVQKRRCRLPLAQEKLPTFGQDGEHAERLSKQCFDGRTRMLVNTTMVVRIETRLQFLFV